VILDHNSLTLDFDLAQYILDCAYAALESDCDSPPDRACVIVGNPAQDDCCDGQLTVGITSFQGSTAFPIPSSGFEPCGAPITLMNMDVSLFRCVPVSEDETPPPCELLAQSAKQIYYEARVIRQRVQCCLNALALSDMIDSVIIGQDIIDPLGGCGGSVLHLTLGVIDGCVCE